MKTLHVYTDGGAAPNPGTGGWGYIIYPDGITVTDFLKKNPPDCFIINSGSEKNTTNNRMEIKAVIEAIIFIKNEIKTAKKLHIYSDSKYVVSTLSEGWTKNKNNDLWDELEKLASLFEIKWHWVKGHSGNVFNQIADELATSEIKNVLV